jgi:2-hydroxy-3-keto-5-methylthiopentenyl-1-phosphate phosphatase
MNELFKQIIYLHKEKIAKVIIVSNDHYFFDDWVSKIPCVDTQDFQRTTIHQMPQGDIQKVIKGRMGY